MRKRSSGLRQPDDLLRTETYVVSRKKSCLRVMVTCETQFSTTRLIGARYSRPQNIVDTFEGMRGI